MTAVDEEFADRAGRLERFREEAARLDGADVLSGFRDRFVTAGGPLAYLDGNSLGRLPKATVGRLARVVEHEWGRRLIRSWDEAWAALPVEVGDRLGSAILGAAPGQTVVADSTTVNLYKAVDAAAGLRGARSEIVIDEANFPTDRYVVEAVAAARGMRVRWIPAREAGVSARALAQVVGVATAVVVLSHVDYRSAYLADMASLTSLVHDAGGLVVWDLSHSAGVVPLRLDADGVDFAVGCTYKYLNAGPGAPAFVYAAARHHARAVQPVPGWFGAADVFAMAPHHQPGEGARLMLSGTPHVLGLACVDEGVALVAEAGVERIRAKSVALTEFARRLVDAALRPLGWAFASPVDPAVRGGHVVVRGAGAQAVAEGMAAAGAIPDFRRPDLVRLGLSPLTTAFTEVLEGISIMARVVAGG